MPPTLASRLRCGSAAGLVLAAMLALAPAHADSRPYYLRNHNPFLQVFGVPAPEGSVLMPAGRLESRLAVSLANHADQGEDSDEAVVLDGESYYVDTRFRYGLGRRWEVGLDIPYVAHRSGMLDNVIEGWHDTFGLDNSERSRPSNHLRLSYQRQGAVLVDLRDGSGGLGDVRLTGAYQLHEGGGGGPSLALRAALELPTGNEDQLRGNGGTDVALGIEGSRRLMLGERRLELYGQAGALLPGDGDLLTDQLKSLVPYGSFGATWQWAANLDLRAQLGLQGGYFDSGLAEIGGSTASLALGGALRLRRLGIEIDLAVVEDLISDATPDLGLYLSVRRARALRAKVGR